MIRTKKSTQYSGFTLVELLVVIAIIAVLATLIIGVTRSMKQSAQAVSCTNNLRQIGVALVAYQGENGGFPSKNDGISWDRAILPQLGYNGNENLQGRSALERENFQDALAIMELFQCPADRKERDPSKFARSYAIVPWTTNWSNGTTFRGWKHRPLDTGVRLTAVNEPSRAAMVVEWHEGTEGTANRVGDGAHEYHDCGGPIGENDTLHKKNQIVLFADGHSESLPFMDTDEFVEDYWPGEIGDLD